LFSSTGAVFSKLSSESRAPDRSELVGLLKQVTTVLKDNEEDYLAKAGAAADEEEKLQNSFTKTPQSLLVNQISLLLELSVRLRQQTVKLGGG
jgi:hypothetical protein